MEEKETNVIYEDKVKYKCPLCGKTLLFASLSLKDKIEKDDLSIKCNKCKNICDFTNMKSEL